MNARRLFIAYLIVLLAGLVTATQWVAYRLNYHPALGGLRIGAHMIYRALGDLHLGPRLR